MTNITQVYYHPSHDEIPIITKIVIDIIGILLLALIIS